MEMKANATIRGAKMFVGTMDDGKSINSGTLFVEVSLKESDNAFGMRTEDMRCKDSEVVKSIKNLPFPFLAELTIVMESTGGKNGMQQKVVAIKPLQRETGKQAPAAG